MELTKEQRQRFFNPEMMERYLNDREEKGTSYLSALRILINASERIEKVLQKNFFEMTVEEYQEHLPKLGVLKIAMLRYGATAINEYNKWAYKNKYSQNYFKLTELIDFRQLDFSEVLKKRIIRNDDAFKKMLMSNIEYPIITNDVLCALLCWVGIDEINEIREVDVLESANKIVLKDKYFSMSPTYMKIISAYMEQRIVETEKIKGKRYKNKSKYLLKYWCINEDMLYNYNDKQYRKENVQVSIKAFLDNINAINGTEYDNESLILSREYLYIYERTKNHQDEEIIKKYISELYPNSRKTFLQDYRVEYEQYLKLYWQ